MLIEFLLPVHQIILFSPFTILLSYLSPVTSFLLNLIIFYEPEIYYPNNTKSLVPPFYVSRGGDFCPLAV